LGFFSGLGEEDDQKHEDEENLKGVILLNHHGN